MIDQTPYNKAFSEDPAMTSKRWYRSKTININIIAGLLIAAEANLQLLQPLLGDIYQPATFVLIVLNVYLRTITTKPVSK